jgi:hypothetical protein
VFGRDPVGHVHQDRAYLAVMLAGPRLGELTAPPPPPPDVLAYGQSHAPSPAHPLARDAGVVVATDDWPFLYMQSPDLPRHYLAALALVLVVSVITVWFARGSGSGPWSWHFFFLGAGFALEIEVDRAVRAVGGIDHRRHPGNRGAHGLASARRQPGRDRRRDRLPRALALIAVNYFIPVGRITFDSRIVESFFYAVLVFSPVFCAGLIFSSSFKDSSSTAEDFGANLLGAMVGGVGEYLSLLAGYQFLLILVAGCYVLAVVMRRGNLRARSVATRSVAG